MNGLYGAPYITFTFISEQNTILVFLKSMQVLRELTSLWRESDVVVKGLAKLHHHVGELLSAWLRAALPWRLVHSVGHLPWANIHLGSGRQLHTTEAGNE